MDAVDYILKSIDFNEFEKTIAHVMEIIKCDKAKDIAIAELEKKLMLSIPLLQQRSLMLLISEDFNSEF